MTTLLTLTPAGLYCPVGDFHIDPCRAVPRAVVTHAHSDHARPGCERYLILEDGIPVFRTRLGNRCDVVALPAGKTIQRNGVTISLHHAGHILGSAQVRLEYRGEIVVITGDYKIQSDLTCAAFEQLRCHTLVTESTFGSPLYRWEEPHVVIDQVNRWWQFNVDHGCISVIFGYSLGKSQRILVALERTIGNIYVHKAIAQMNEAYRACGVIFPPMTTLELDTIIPTNSIVVLPPGSRNAIEQLSTIAPVRTATVSGWMQLKSFRQRTPTDAAFVLSDHADWAGLNSVITASQAENILVTHGASALLARWWQEKGKNAQVLTHESFAASSASEDEPTLDGGA